MIEVPFTQEQVDALNRWQNLGHVHPFTCPNRMDGKHQSRPERGGDLGALLATPSGWICGDCTYTQWWAHEFMLSDPPNALDDLFQSKTSLMPPPK